METRAYVYAVCGVQVITRILQSSTPAVKLRATDILLSALAHDPMPLRNFLANPNGRQLLNSLVVEFVSSDESGLPEQIAELLKQLVDPGGWRECCAVLCCAVLCCALPWAGPLSICGSVWHARWLGSLHLLRSDDRHWSHG
jgi:hypothetical protein